MILDLNSTEISLIMYALRPNNFRGEIIGIQERAAELQKKIALLLSTKTENKPNNSFFNDVIDKKGQFIQEPQAWNQKSNYNITVGIMRMNELIEKIIKILEKQPEKKNADK